MGYVFAEGCLQLTPVLMNSLSQLKDRSWLYGPLWKVCLLHKGRQCSSPSHLAVLSWPPWRCEAVPHGLAGLDAEPQDTRLPHVSGTLRTQQWTPCFRDIPTQCPFLGPSVVWPCVFTHAFSDTILHIISAPFHLPVFLVYSRLQFPRASERMAAP